MAILPIENYPDLLIEYGRASAWCNSVEDYLSLVILGKGGLNKANYKMTSQILEEMMFGKKIRLTQNILNNALIKKLWKLNDKRLILDHGITGEKVPIDNPALRTGKMVINHKSKEHIFDKKFLADIVRLAKEILEDLRKEPLTY
jgi:hypothetical protein